MLAALFGAAITLAAAVTPRVAQAQWTTTYEQFYLQASHNWTFRNQYASADRLFNAFDYGHAILYETLWTKPNAPASRLEEKEFDYLTKTVLVKPPRVPLEEAAIEPMYAQLAPEAKMMFDWAHLLHRQLYDVLADERLSDRQRDAEAQRLLAYYKSRPDLAFSAKPKTMALMQEQSYSLAFRKRYPKFNGLIWGYHWLQVGLYEPLVVGTTTAAKQAGVRATVARFFQMVDGAPSSLPYQMPMTAAVAPAFTARFPEAAIIFDNLHSMHDVVSDILTNSAVPRAAKRAEIMRAARLYRDDTSFVMPVAAWLAMSNHMGIENMGGVAVGFVSALPTPSVTAGAVMTHDWATGAMLGFTYGGAADNTGADAHAGHVMAAMPTPMPMPMASPGATAGDSADVAALVSRFHRALEAGDSATVVALLADNATIMEGGAVETVADYRAHHLSADIAFAVATQATRSAQQVTVRGDLAYSTARTVTTGTFRNRAVNTAGAELMVASRTGNGWRISAIHWSSRERN
jgi:ketosteroid isomerase-like protein